MPTSNPFAVTRRHLGMAEGDCYEAAGRYIMDRGILGSDKHLILVHGEVAGQGALEGTNFGHAWVLDHGMVIDKSNGRNLRLPKAIYYAMGAINQINNFHEYDPNTVRHMILQWQHWGPWDLETSTGL